MAKPCCSQCEGIELTFDEESVDNDLRAYRAEGPDKTTAWMLDELEEQGVEGLTLLDIGGGVGAIQHELLVKGAISAVHVDASSAYIAAAQREAKRRKLNDRIQWRHGNFVDLAAELAPADIVTLDKVICCYDDMPGLVRSSARLAKRYYGIVLPRDTWWFRAAARAANFVQRIFRNPFQLFVHPHKKMEGIIRKAGLKRIYAKDNFIWHVAVYKR
ncbi:MAG: methyltransferase domain-containing protein [Anaerolineales bacterium]